MYGTQFGVKDKFAKSLMGGNVCFYASTGTVVKLIFFLKNKFWYSNRSHAEEVIVSKRTFNRTDVYVSDEETNMQLLANNAEKTSEIHHQSSSYRLTTLHLNKRKNFA